MALVSVKDLSFSYQIEDRKIPVLKNVSLNVEKGDFVAIQGPSGSGKSTLFYILGCLLRAPEGEVLINGKDISRLSNLEMSVFRNRTIGFVFQHFHLLPRASVLDNIMLPTHYPWELPHTPAEEAKAYEKATGLASRLGLSDYLNNRPNQLSGGQQQRVAIARALMNDVQLILADEPTGNLDSAHAGEIMSLLNELNCEGKTIILITHDSEVAHKCKSIMHIRDGVLVQETKNSNVAVSFETQEMAKPAVTFSLSPMRLLKSALPISMDSLKRNKARSFLTMLGVTIGIASVLAMMTFGEYTKKKILESYETLGINKISIWGYQNWNQKSTDKVPNQFKEFTVDGDLPALKRVFSEVKYLSPVFVEWSTDLNYGGRVITDNGRMKGSNTDYLAITNRSVSLGRFLSPYNIKYGNPVCVIGSEVAEKLFEHTSPLGEILFLTSSNREPAPCKVIGVLASQQSNRDWEKPNLEVIVPYTYFTAVAEDWNTHLHNVLMQAKSGIDMEKLSKRIKNYFKLRYGKSGEFGADSDVVLIAQMKKFLNLFTLLLTAVAMVSLTVGGIGINNMMLVSLNERVKEIGLFKALGATNKSIRFQFIMESILLCSLAGFTGVVIGFSSYEAIIFIASKFVSKLQFEWVFNPLAFIISVVAILAVGVMSGLTPAVKAEKLDVIEALRSE